MKPEKTGKIKYPQMHTGSWRIPAMTRTGTIALLAKVIDNVEYP
jgi:hypothetical protein